MTLAPHAPARRSSRRAGAPPCDPNTLGAVCVGGCGRRLHPRPPKGASKAACAERHPVADRGAGGDAWCTNCAAAYRLAHPRPTRRSRAWLGGDALTYYCTHDEDEPGCYCGGAV